MDSRRAAGFDRVRPIFLYLALAALSLATSALVGARLPQHLPHTHDEFAYLFAGRTFAQFQLTNPSPALPEFFESQHILTTPSFMAKYPPAPGLALAVGCWLGDPIYGVWLACAAFVVATAWMLRAFFSVRWALVGGVFVVAQFGLTYYWAQTFWGGALTATAGALIFGAACRLARQPHPRDALLLGVGVALFIHTRPFEGLLACVVPAALVFRRLARGESADWRRLVLPAGAVIAAAAAFLAYFNFRVTGSPWLLPYLAYERLYLGSPVFIWQSAPTTEPAFNNSALGEFYRDFVLLQPYPPDQILPMLWLRLQMLGTDFFGWIFGPLALLGAVWRPRRAQRLALASVAVCALPLVLSYYFLPHYQAPAAALAGLLAVAGARRIFLTLPRRFRVFAVFLPALAVLEAFSLAADHSVQRRIDHLRAPAPREKFSETLRAAGGRHLVFVRLVKPYNLHDTWVYNLPPLDANPVLWVWDRGPAENQKLLRLHPDRHGVLMTIHEGKITFAAVPTAP